MAGENDGGFTPQNSTEEDILNRHINSAIDSQDTPDASETPEEGTSSQAPDTAGTPTQTQERQQSNVAGTDTSGTKDAQTQQAPQQGQPSADDSGTPKRARPDGLTEDKDGNLVGPNGQIVIERGAQRRLYEANSQLKMHMAWKDKHIATLQRQLEQANDGGAASQALNGLPQQLGLNPEQTSVGLRMAAAWNRDPVATAKYLLKELVSMGHNIQDVLGPDAGAGIATNGLVQAIQQQLAPLTQQQRAQQEEQRRQQGILERRDAFVAKYPNAVYHEHALMDLVQKRGMSPEEAYLRLENFATRYNLDMTKPLGPQYLALRQQAAQQQPQQQTPQTPARQTVQPPLGNGRGDPAIAQNVRPAVNASSSWDDMISQSLDEVGWR